MGVQNSPPAPSTTAAVTSAFAGAGSPGAKPTSCDGGGLNAGAAPARSGGCAARLSRSDTRAWTAAKLWAAPQKAQYATGKPNAMAHAVQRTAGDRAAFMACFRNEHAARRTCACGQLSSLLAASAPGPTVRISRSCLTMRPLARAGASRQGRQHRRSRQPFVTRRPRAFYFIIATISLRGCVVLLQDWSLLTVVTALAGLGQQRKQGLLFREKEAKSFCSRCRGRLKRHASPRHTRRDQKFFGSFFKKEPLACLLTSKFPEAPPGRTLPASGSQP